MTLQRFCKKIMKDEKLEVGYKAPGSIFTLEQENLLNHYVVHASKIYFGLSPQLFRNWPMSLQLQTTLNIQFLGI